MENKHKISAGELWYGLPLLIFIGFAIFAPVGIYNDTAQYIGMHIHRDSLYCLWLLLLRTITGGAEWYLNIAVWAQNLFAGFSVIYLTKVVKREFGLTKLVTVLVCVLAMAPHLMTPIAASSHLILTNSIMSESITYPLFYIFVAHLIRMTREYSGKSKWYALLFATLLSFARGQMMVMMLVWLVVTIYMIIVTRRQIIVRILAMCLIFGMVFALRSVVIKSYNLIFNRYYTGPTMSTVSLLTNIVYASDEDAVTLVGDTEAAGFLGQTLKAADGLQYNYKYAPEGFMGRALDLEEKHDRIKFECIDELWRPIHDMFYPELQNDYELETIEQDRIAGVIIKKIWPKCFGTWLYDYLGLATCGFIRTVAFVHPIINVYAALVYLLLIAGVIVLWNNKKDRADNIRLIRLGLLTVLTVCANVLGTASVIMCLSRYMVYTLPLVYISVILIWIKIVQRFKDPCQ